MPVIVEFQLQDITYPNPVEVLWKLYATTRLKGQVITATDDGGEPGRFLVVQVSGLSEPVIVPVEKTSHQPTPSLPDSAPAKLRPGQQPLPK